MESSGPVLGSAMRATPTGESLPRGLIPATLAALVFAALTLLVGAASGAPPDFLVLDAAIGLTYIGAGVIAWLRRPEVITGPLLVACGAFNFVGSYGPTGQPVVTHLGFAFEAYYDVALAVIVLALPGRWPTGVGRYLATALFAVFLVRSASRLLLQDPSMFGCAECTPNPFVIASHPSAFITLETASNGAIVVIALAIAVECLRRLVASRPMVRRVMWPILIGGIVAMAVTAFDAAEYAVSTATGEALVDLPEPWSAVLSWSTFGARLLVPIGLLTGSLALRRAGGPLVPLAVSLERVPSPLRLQAALAAALGDPEVRLLRADPGGGWMAADGRPAAAPVEDADHAVTRLEHDGRPMAAIVHDPVLREDPTLVRSVMAVLRLAVENERLDGALQSQLEEVRASRARLAVAAADERRRIERDLHDGAQQRLVAVTLALQQARQAATDGADLPELETRLAAAADELKGAITDLRELARGIHPALLEDDGLPAAVTALARRANLPVEARVEVDRRLPSHIEATAYFVVAEALTNASRHAAASRATVSIRDLADRLTIDVEDDGVGGADPSRGSGLAGLADRVASVDGRLAIDSPMGRGTRIRVEIPLP